MWCRTSKKCRMGIIGGLMLVVLLLAIFMKKWTIAFSIIFIILASALALDGFEYDVDLWKLWETGSYEESRVQYKKWVKVMWNCISDNLNCSDFKTQPEAQKKYDSCMVQIKENNVDAKNPSNLDIYGLDWNKNGIVCENLPWLPVIAK